MSHGTKNRPYIGVVAQNRTLLSSALVRHGDDRSWLAFGEPSQTKTVWDLDDVLDALTHAQDAARAGSWIVGMLSYDAGPAFDPAVVSRRDDETPLLAFGIFDDAVPSEGPKVAPFEISEWEPDQDFSRYEQAISAVREYIQAGETYQVNYTMRRHAAFWGSAEGLFAALSRAQNAKHDAFLHFGTHALCSASPELFFTRTGNALLSRPMKGTRPRHFDPEVDASLAHDLTSSLKDRAENVMIVDMVRNDLGRIAQTGSVSVPSLLEIEQYPTVHTMTSTVCLLYTSPSPRDRQKSRMPSSA